MKAISWPLALVVSVGIAGVVVLTLLHADATNLMLVVVSLVGGVGATQLGAVKSQTNGNMSRLLDIIERQNGGKPSDQAPPEG